MKKLLLILLFSGCSTGRQTGQQKAEAAVKEYIMKHANDASSYEPVSFGKLDSIYVVDNEFYDQLDIARKKVVEQYNNAKNKGLPSAADSLKEELLTINNQMDAGRSLSGLKIYHVSQGENMEGIMVMNRGSFYLDTNFVVKEYVMSGDSLLKENELP